MPDDTKNSSDPLLRDGLQWVPNVAHVFRQDQHLYFLYELYDPARQKGAPTPAAAPGLERREGGPVHVLTSIQFMSGGSKVYETSLVAADVINEPQHSGVAFECDVPLEKRKPGVYVCQVNVSDDAGGSFTFPRMAMRVNAAASPSTAAAPAPTDAGMGDPAGPADPPAPPPAAPGLR